MRRRIMGLVLVVTTLAMGTLGILLPVSVRASVNASFQQRADDTARVAVVAVVIASTQGQVVTPELPSRLVRDEAELTATLPDGHVVSTGAISREGAFAATESSGGVRVTAVISRSTATARVLYVGATILAACLIAIAVGMLVAARVSRRLTDPYSDFALTAGRLSTGDRRTLGKRYGIPELDAVAEVLDQGVRNFNEVLEAERRLTADASHQLRTPLAALSLRLEQIATTTDPEVVRSETAAALLQVERLTGVVDHIVLSARGHRGAPVGPIQIDELVTAQIQECAPAFQAAGRAVIREGRCGLVANGVVGAESQVLATLLENSLRHREGQVIVRTRQAGTWVVLEVSDEGPGVRANLAPRVFERDVSGNPDLGNGLGLALARTLVAADGGRLELLTAVPARFAVFLPCWPRLGVELDAEVVVQPQTTGVERVMRSSSMPARASAGNTQRR